MVARQYTKRLLTGIATYVPGVRMLSERSTGGTDSATYCYEVWLRHLILARDAGLPTDPVCVAEVGPGDSLGTGIAALLTGVARYVAVDLVEYVETGQNVAMIDPIRDLLAVRTPIHRPGETGPDGGDGPVFPDDILDERRLEAALLPDRIRAIRAAVSRPGTDQDGIRVAYSAGEQKTLDLTGTVDLAFSQAVLEHVDDLEQVYGAISAALRPGGGASHAIDFKSHDFARDWNGHWTFSDREWSLIRGRRRFAINREPLATHLRLIEASGLEVVNVVPTNRPSRITRNDLAPRFRGLSDEDLRTSSAVIQAVKR